MQLTRFTDLGLRVLMYLAQETRPDPVTNAELASVFQVPHNHVIKVVHRLGQLGWVDTQRGRGGGLRLGTDLSSLRLGHVLRTLEGVEQLIDCTRPPCVLRGHCLLKGVLDDALGAFYDHLDEKTVADVCRPPTARTLLHLHRRHDANR